MDNTENDLELEETQTEPLNFDPKEVEAELVRQAQARSEDPTETAAGAYQMYVPHFKRMLPGISTRGLRRVLNFLVLYPLEVDSVKSASESEKQFMQLVNSLVEAKFVMIMDSYNKNAQAMYDAQNAPLTAEETTSVISELRAGGVSEEEIERLTKQHKENSNG